MNARGRREAKPQAIDVPPDFKKALGKNTAARAAFEKLPPSHKRAYIEAIVEAKKPEIRERRIKGALEMLAKGTP